MLASPDGGTTAAVLAHLSSRSSSLAGLAADLLARERRSRLEARGGGAYARHVGSGDVGRVCVICRGVRGLRTFHCKDCGRCVQRLDHHCPWVDNCVGIRNQRLFFCWLLGLLCFLFLAMRHCLRSARGASPRGLSWAAPSVALLLVDSALVAFVASLLARQAVYATVNLTTFEALLCPAHVQQRFPRRDGRLWFLSGATLAGALVRCRSFWLLDTRSDVEDFGASPGEHDAEGCALAESGRCWPWPGAAAAAGAPYTAGCLEDSREAIVASPGCSRAVLRGGSTFSPCRAFGARSRHLVTTPAHFGVTEHSEVPVPRVDVLTAEGPQARTMTL